MNGKSVKIPLIFSIIVLLAPMVFAAKAEDQVSIRIKMSGDAYVQIDNNGTVTFIYNGLNVLRDVKGDIKWLQSRVNSNKLAIMLIRRDMGNLIYALNETFSDVYGRMYYLAYVTGLTHNSSKVTLLLKSGNMTITDFLDQLINVTEKHDMMIQNLTVEVKGFEDWTEEKLNLLADEIMKNREYFENQTLAIKNSLDEHKQTTSVAFADVNKSLQHLDLKINSLKDGVKVAIFAIGFLQVFMLLMLVWVARWKAKEAKQQ